MLVSSNPRIIAFDNNWATSTKGVFDFFKPYRTITKEAIVKNENNDPWFDNLETEIEIHKDQPVFDGQFQSMLYGSYANAYFSFKKLKTQPELYTILNSIIITAFSFRAEGVI